MAATASAKFDNVKEIGETVLSRELLGVSQA